MGIRTWWTHLRQAVQRDRRSHETPVAPNLTRAEQDVAREAHRQTGMSAEDRAWEQASLQRDRDRQAHARQAAEQRAP